MKALALVAALVGINACAPDDACDIALAEYRAAKDAGADAATVEAEWLDIPLWCEGRPDRP